MIHFSNHGSLCCSLHIHSHNISTVGQHNCKYQGTAFLYSSLARTLKTPHGHCWIPAHFLLPILSILAALGQVYWTPDCWAPTHWMPLRKLLLPNLQNSSGKTPHSSWLKTDALNHCCLAAAARRVSAIYFIPFSSRASATRAGKLPEVGERPVLLSEQKKNKQSMRLKSGASHKGPDDQKQPYILTHYWFKTHFDRFLVLFIQVHYLYPLASSAATC